MVRGNGKAIMCVKAAPVLDLDMCMERKLGTLMGACRPSIREVVVGAWVVSGGFSPGLVPLKGPDAFRLAHWQFAAVLRRAWMVAGRLWERRLGVSGRH